MTQNIATAQNSARHLRLQRAANVVHARVALIDRTRWVLALLVVLATYVALVVPETQPFAAAAALLYAAVGELLVQIWMRRLNTQAAVLQEQFDTSLFELEWQLEEAKPTEEWIVRLSESHRGSDAGLRNWYVDVTGMKVPVAQIICQRQALLWDANLRTEWSWVITSLVAGFFALSTIGALIADATVRGLTVWVYAPLLPLAVPAVVSVIQHRISIRKRQAAYARVNTELDKGVDSPNRVKALWKLCAETQKVIFETRSTTPRVPNWYYKRRQARYAKGFEVEADGFRAQWPEGS